MPTLARPSRLGALLATAAVATGCTLDEQRAPSLAGPSGLAYQVSLAAAPDFVLRDGSSVSVITATVRGADGQTLGAQRLRLSWSTMTAFGRATASPDAPGRLSVSEVVTGSNGQATFAFTAPGVSDDVAEAVIGATPVGTDAADNVMRTVRVRVIGPSVPIPSFTVSPEKPEDRRQFEKVTFDASGTKLGGSTCSGCTYVWEFGSEAAGSGEFTQYAFRSSGNHRVRLTVAAPSGATASSSQVVSVGDGRKPTASFFASPASVQLDNTGYVVVNVNASASTTANGATIAEYRWNFDPAEETTTTPTASVKYTIARSYVISLIVLDSNGTPSPPVTQTVTVTAAPVAP